MEQAGQPTADGAFTDADGLDHLGEGTGDILLYDDTNRVAELLDFTFDANSSSYLPIVWGFFGVPLEPAAAATADRGATRSVVSAHATGVAPAGAARLR